MMIEDFKIRMYTKKELALMVWIRRCRPLWAELQNMGYCKTNKSFSPKQVKAIVYYLGEPG